MLRSAIHCMYHCLCTDLKNLVSKSLVEEKIYDYLVCSFTQLGFQINILKSPDGQALFICLID